MTMSGLEGGRPSTCDSLSVHHCQHVGRNLGRRKALDSEDFAVDCPNHLPSLRLDWNLDTDDFATFKFYLSYDEVSIVPISFIPTGRRGSKCYLVLHTAFTDAAA